MIPLAAYADRLSVRPGRTIRFHVANATGEPVAARLVRVISADPNPAGPGIRLEPLDAQPVRLRDPAPETVHRGSYAVIEGLDGRLRGDGLTFACRVLPTLVDGREHTLAARGTPGAGGGFALRLDGTGRLVAEIGEAAVAARCDRPLEERAWHVVWLRYDAGAGRLEAGHAPLGDGLLRDRSPEAAGAPVGPGATGLGTGPLLVAARGLPEPAEHLNGKLESPALWDRALGDDEIAALAAGGDPPADALAAWDLGRDPGTDRVVDVGPHGLHGRLVNTPARAMTGSRWAGREMCFRHAPAEYGAIHFHEDDVDDCRWPAAFEWTVPAGTRSAVYALLLEAGGERENVPFHVVPPAGRPEAPIALLASTFTYTVYGNHARPEWDADPAWQAAWREQSAAWGAYPHNPGDHREYGLSTYNWHPDRSGISIASWHRPMLNVRIGYVTYPGEPVRASGLRHFPADSHLVAWLEAKGHRYDVITDAELHEEGFELLRHYPVVLTGSHPEYHTREMLDALAAYRDAGGRLAYLGGNGFYWKIALSPGRDGVIEIRRGEGGIRAWAAEPGEYYNQLDGEYGGMWRRNGRPPQRLCGVGFTAQGNFVGSYYRRRPEAADPRVAWILDGVEGEILGDHGLSGHGAAGFELDRADKRLGTPAHAVVIASSENHPPDAPWVLVPEEVLTHIVTWPGEPAPRLIRADLTFFETPAGGAVFSTGSITFCGSLPTDGFDNDVSRLLDNVVRRFLDPTPFPMP